MDIFQRSIVMNASRNMSAATLGYHAVNFILFIILFLEADVKLADISRGFFATCCIYVQRKIYRVPLHGKLVFDYKITN